MCAWEPHAGKDQFDFSRQAVGCDPLQCKIVSAPNRKLHGEFLWQLCGGRVIPVLGCPPVGADGGGRTRSPSSRAGCLGQMAPPPTTASEELVRSEPLVCGDPAPGTGRLRSPSCPAPQMHSWLSRGACDFLTGPPGACAQGPSLCSGTHAICQWRGVTRWAPLEDCLQSSRLVARALIIRSNCGLRFHKPGGRAGGGRAAKVTPKSLLNRWCER